MLYFFVVEIIKENVWNITEQVMVIHAIVVLNKDFKNQISKYR